MGQADARQGSGRTALQAGSLASPRRLGLPGAIAIAARLVTAAGLSISSFVHADLASTYAEGGGTISEGALFRAETVLASLTALAMVLTGRRLCLLLGFGVAASALAATLASRYVDLGAVGPFPDLHDPVWFPEKLWAAFGEGTAVLAALTGIIAAGVHRSSQHISCAAS
jgi:hypothetical protein